jgi:hypothetical protein
LRHFFRRKNIDGILKTAELMPVSSAQIGTSGVKIITAAYKELSRSKKTQSAGLIMLRAYVRQQRADETTRKIIAYLTKELGSDIRRPLEVTYLINTFMGGIDIMTYADDVHLAVRFLHDIVALYENKRILSATDLRNALVVIAGGVGKTERRELADYTLSLAKAAVSLGKQYRDACPRNEERHLDALLKQETDPKSGLDIFWVMSGFFGRLRRVPLQLKSVTYPLKNRAFEDMVDEVSTTANLLNGGAKAFPAQKPVTVTMDEVCAELGDLRNAIPYEDRVETLRNLARDLQQLVALITKIEADGDAKAVENSGLARKIGSGKYSPKSTLEFLRYVHAFFDPA